MNYIKPFSEIRITDVAHVGGKTASLGEMIWALVPQGIKVPDGFAITADAYWYFLDHNAIGKTIAQILAQWKDINDIAQLETVGAQIRALINKGEMPDDLRQEISIAYKKLSAQYNEPGCAVAVRSSATAEDLPGASFAGAQETFLNVSGESNLITRCKECFASLYTNRAIMYRKEKGFDTVPVALSIAVQKMVRSDIGCSGVAFSLDTESGFKDVVVINASYGLGEAIVQGKVTPDEYIVHKPLLQKGFAPLLKKVCGSKQEKMIYASQGNGIITVPVSDLDQKSFALTDEQIFKLAHAVILVEKHYSALLHQWTPMDIEWGLDGSDHTLYILQARPETVHAQESAQLIRYELNATNSLTLLATGQSIGQHIVQGTARIMHEVSDAHEINCQDIIITHMTDPDWMPLLKRAGGIITKQGGRTCHAAIVSRELGIAAIVGAQNIFEQVKEGDQITLDCSQGKKGYVYAGHVPFTKHTIDVQELPQSPTKLMINLADPDRALSLAWMPVAGVGLARIEFIINTAIKIHPMALINPEPLTQKEQEAIAQLTAQYTDKKQFFTDQLAQGIATIAAAFWPKPVIVRLSDFKSNEYRNLIGGQHFEPVEENPMLGFRGAIRYCDQRFRPAFILECHALKKVRDDMGFTNVIIMVPFVRSTQEGAHVLSLLEQQGLKKGSNGLSIIMMCEIPSNVLLIKDFSALFDGFSIGSNDLTQLTLGADRDSGLLAGAFDERDPAVKEMLRLAVQGAHANNRPIGICGQAPSDYPEIADFLIDLGIDSLSLNPDTVVPFLLRFASK